MTVRQCHSLAIPCPFPVQLYLFPSVFDAARIELCRCVALTRVNAANNVIASIPSALADLTGLTLLNLRANRLGDVGAVMACATLCELLLDANAIEAVR